MSMVEARLGTDDVLMLGSGRDRAIDKLAHLRRDSDPHGRTARLPKLAIDALVKEDTKGDVGGSLSIGIASRQGFGLYGFVQPIEVGKPPAWRAFNGIDLDSEIGVVGPCVIGMSAMI
jgi:hypothetical protein